MPINIRELQNMYEKFLNTGFFKAQLLMYALKARSINFSSREEITQIVKSLQPREVQDVFYNMFGDDNNLVMIKTLVEVVEGVIKARKHKETKYSEALSTSAFVGCVQSAISHGAIKNVKYIHEERGLGFEFVLPADDGNTFVHEAIKYNQVPVVNYYARKKIPNSFKQKNASGLTPHDYAVSFGSNEMVDIITTNGAAVTQYRPEQIEGLLRSPKLEYSVPESDMDFNSDSESLGNYFLYRALEPENAKGAEGDIKTAARHFRNYIEEERGKTEPDIESITSAAIRYLECYNILNVHNPEIVEYLEGCVQHDKLALIEIYNTAFTVQHNNGVLSEEYPEKGFAVLRDMSEEEIMEDPPVIAFLYYNSGIATKQKNYTKALEQFQKAHELHPADHDLRVQLYKAYCMDDRLEEMRAQINANGIGQYQYLYELYYYAKHDQIEEFKGLYSAHSQDLKQLINTSIPEVAAVKFNIEAFHLFTKGKASAIKDVCFRAMRDNPDDANEILSMGLCLLNILKKYEVGISLLDKVPKNACAKEVFALSYNKFAIYENVGRKAEANLELEILKSRFKEIEGENDWQANYMCQIACKVRFENLMLSTKDKLVAYKEAKNLVPFLDPQVRELYGKLVDRRIAETPEEAVEVVAHPEVLEGPIAQEPKQDDAPASQSSSATTSKARRPYDDIIDNLLSRNVETFVYKVDIMVQGGLMELSQLPEEMLHAYFLYKKANTQFLYPATANRTEHLWQIGEQRISARSQDVVKIEGTTDYYAYIMPGVIDDLAAELSGAFKTAFSTGRIARDQGQAGFKFLKKGLVEIKVIGWDARVCADTIYTAKDGSHLVVFNTLKSHQQVKDYIVAHPKMTMLNGFVEAQEASADDTPSFMEDPQAYYSSVLGAYHQDAWLAPIGEAFAADEWL